jgi:hypothetical protein
VVKTSKSNQTWRKFVFFTKLLSVTSYLYENVEKWTLSYENVISSVWWAIIEIRPLNIFETESWKGKAKWSWTKFRNELRKDWIPLQHIIIIKIMITLKLIRLRHVAHMWETREAEQNFLSENLERKYLMVDVDGDGRLTLKPDITLCLIFAVCIQHRLVFTFLLLFIEIYTTCLGLIVHLQLYKSCA